MLYKRYYKNKVKVDKKNNLGIFVATIMKIYNSLIIFRVYIIEKGKYKKREKEKDGMERQNLVKYKIKKKN